jgi:hypothetical protein
VVIVDASKPLCVTSHVHENVHYVLEYKIQSIQLKLRILVGRCIIIRIV